jgi:SpoIVB peptidase S55
LKDIRAGLKGTGRTVFSGTRIDEFQVEILGVLENIGPKQSLILARLSGGPLAETGVLQGMSGSPVYIDGRLVGAVAMAFAFSKEPIAGIRPIEEMLRAALPEQKRAQRLALPAEWQAGAQLPPREDVLAGGQRMVDIATPVSFGGFTRAAIEHFAPRLRALGLEPMQGMSAGGRLEAGLGDPSQLKPGSMISVQLLAGDLSIGADGTLTYIDGDRIYAFGHRFLAAGATDLPFARSEVLTLLPNLSSSFKISAAREWMGSITEDRSTAVAGRLGRRAAMVPVSISVTERASGARPARASSYRFQMVKDPVLSPFLLEMAMFSALDATERAAGQASFGVSGTVEFEGGFTPLKLSNMYSGDFNLAAQAAVSTASPIAYAIASGFDGIQLKSIALEIESFPRKRELQIDQVWTSRREVRPGETVDVTVVLSGANGAELARKVSYAVPAGAPPGPLQFTVADAATINITEFRQLVMAAPKSAVQLISFLNALRANTKAYVRVWRMLPAYEVEGETLPDPPPSAAMILARSQPSLSMMPALPNSKLAELEIDAGDMTVSGAKTIQVEVKEQ